MTDVAQILGVGKAAENKNAETETTSAPHPPPTIPPSHQPSRAMKMQGMSREVLDLISGKNRDSRSAELPPIMPTKILGTAGDGKSVKVGSKWISTQRPARPWTWAPFTSSSRTDGLSLNHWVRANVEYPDYPYARFDIHLDPIVYSDDEYQAYLKSEDWTRSETDFLMELARRYELRWPVIHDRWLEAFHDEKNLGATKSNDTQKQQEPRRVEDLQHRYYSVAALLTQSQISREAAMEAKMLESATPNEADPGRTTDQLIIETAAARALAASDPQHQPLIHNLGSGSSNKVFDLVRERERREQMEALWNRTKEEEWEEAELRKELHQIEVQLRKLKKKGAHILAASTGGGPGGSAKANHLGSAGLSSRSASRSVTPVPAAAAAGPTVAEAAASLDHAFASTAPTPMPQYPYLQSGRLAPPAAGVGLNKSLLTRMDTVLEELKVPDQPLPTKRVCDLYDTVRKDVLTLLILQKHALQKEGLVQSRRLKLAKMGGNVRVVDEETLLGIAPPPPASSPRAATKGPRVPKTKAPVVGGTGSTKGNKAKKEVKAGGEGKDVLAAPAPVGEKKPRKPSAKRKRKPDTKSPAVGAATATATTTAPLAVQSTSGPVATAAAAPAVAGKGTASVATKAAPKSVAVADPSGEANKSSAGKKRARKS